MKTEGVGVMKDKTIDLETETSLTQGGVWEGRVSVIVI